MFKKLGEFFKSAFSRKKKQEEWDARFTDTTRADNLPLDPAKDPWRT